MELQTTPQTYLVPATSQALNKALTTLTALGIKYEEPHVPNSQTGPLLALEAHVPFFLVVHYLDLAEKRGELVTIRRERTERLSHREASSGNYGEIATTYEAGFFSAATQAQLVYAVTDLIVHEFVIRHFAAQGVSIQKVTLSKSANEALSAPRSSHYDEWYAFAEEARPVVPGLAELLGAV
jgi:hypothetical protein